MELRKQWWLALAHLALMQIRVFSSNTDSANKKRSNLVKVFITVESRPVNPNSIGVIYSLIVLRGGKKHSDSFFAYLVHKIHK